MEIGDWAATEDLNQLYRELQDMPDVRLVRLSQPSTGLARYDYVNVQDRTAQQLSQQRIDIAREVHDGVVQRLFGVSLALDAPGEFPEDARRRAAAEIQHALSDLKDVVQQPLGRTARPTGTTLADEVKRLVASHGELGGETVRRLEGIGHPSQE